MRAISTLIDRFNLVVEAKDITTAVLNATATNSLNPTIVATAALLAISATATGTNNSPIFANANNRGIQLYVNVTSLTVNSATIGLNLMGKDPVTGLLYQVGRVSLDGIVANGQQQAQFYPGISGTGRDSVALPPTVQVQASLTISTTASMSGLLSFTVGGALLI